MKKDLFRKESIEHISSPDELHDYMRVTSPKLWMLLSAILVLLAGFIFYASTAQMESTLSLKLQSMYGLLTADIPVEQLDIIKMHMPVRVSGMTGYVSEISQDTRLRLTIAFDDGEGLEDGYYELEFMDTAGLPEELASQPLYLSVAYGTASTYNVSSELQSVLKTDRRIRVNGRLGTITDAGLHDVAYIFVVLNDDTHPLPDGLYDAVIVTESTTPISFLLN